MQLVQTVRAMQEEANAARRAGRTLALVPTMGALHRGHLALVEAAREQADHVTVSLFVNPTQFGPGEDFDQYPRTLEADRAALREAGSVDVLFAPSVDEMYPDGPAAHRTWIDVEDLGRHLCGAFRPGHFRGVTTVVAKLLACCMPDRAFFGLKDAQQYFILRRMVRDLNLGVDVVGVPTVREADGLALSSRNIYLSPDERRQAVVLSRAVAGAREQVEGGEQRGGAIVETMLRTLRQAPDGRVQYAQVVDVETLQPVERLEPGRRVLAAVAVYFGATRLIDNAIVCVPDPTEDQVTGEV